MKIIKVEVQVEGEPSSKKRSWNWETISKIVGVIVALAGLWYTAIQYRASEKWKRAEFVVQEVKKFNEADYNNLIDQALDYSKTTYFEYRDTFVDIDEVKFNKALDTTDGVLIAGNALILRNAFDSYFDHLSLFNRYIKSEVMTFEEIKPYFEYYIKIIADTNNMRISTDSRKQLWAYINKYEFTDVQELCCLYGYNISFHKNMGCNPD